jgi:predicted AlkP superfamily pyrophosphatase or phosphodiesterase
MTGATPAEHGVFANLEFDPEQRFAESWYWYAAQVRVPTLWHAVHIAHRVTASIGWPVTVGSTDIDYLIPEYWRIGGSTQELNPSDRYLIAALSRPVDLLDRLQASVGAYLMGNDTSVHGDEIKTRYALDILRRYKPTLMTLHLSSLDEAEHAQGVFSTPANQTLESIDGLLAQLAAAARAADPTTIVAVVSDHGFAPIAHRVNLLVPFIETGLVTTAEDPATHGTRIASWKAQPWLAGGMAAVMLRDPADHATERQVGELLGRLAADPRNGIARIDGRPEIRNHGAFPQAAFLVVLQPGYYAGQNLTGEWVTDLPGSHGGHGYSPEFPEMRAALFLSGPGIPHGRSLGVIDMRQIAPTVARLLGVPFPSAGAAPLSLGITQQ